MYQGRSYLAKTKAVIYLCASSSRHDPVSASLPLFSTPRYITLAARFILRSHFEYLNLLLCLVSVLSLLHISPFLICSVVLISIFPKVDNNLPTISSPMFSYILTPPHEQKRVSVVPVLTLLAFSRQCGAYLYSHLRNLVIISAPLTFAANKELAVFVPFFPLVFHSWFVVSNYLHFHIVRKYTVTIPS